MVLSGRAAAGSGCALSHKYTFVYVHVLKSGGMTIKAFLKRALCGTTQMPCPTGLLEIVDCAAALRQHQDYFVFSFVRNPFARLFSGYSMAIMYGKEENATFPEHPQFSFEDFALEQKTRFKSHVSETHYAPQFVFLFDKKNCPVFDYVGRLENFDEDLNRILTLIGSPELEHALRNGTLQHEQSTAYGSRSLQRQSLAQAYSNEQVMRAVAWEYARDFQLFGYNATTVPRK